MRIILVGHVCIDVNESESSTYTNWGSALMYISHYMRDKLGLSPKMLAPYGNDFLRYTAGFDFVNPVLGDKTLVYRNFLHAIPRRWECQNVQATQPVSIAESTERIIEQADIICLAPLLPNYSVDYVKDLLAHKKPGALTVLQAAGYLRRVDTDGNVSPRDFAEAEQIIPLFDMVMFSQDDHADSQKLAQKWADSARSTNIIVTEGAEGATWFQAKKVPVHIATKAVADEDIVDSVGCGDVLCAATMYEYFLNHDMQTAIQAGNHAARTKLFSVGV